jgi:predicted phosphodiesterase
MSSNLERILFVPDSHHPYADMRAWRTMLKAARVFKPDRVVVLGDFLDCASISHHSKDPTRVAGFQNEVNAANRALDDLERLNAKNYHFVEGNHEFWLPRYLQAKAPELCGLAGLSIPGLLGLGRRGWTYTP